MEDNQNNLQKEKRPEVNIYYINNTITDYELPLNLNEFRNEIKSIYHIESNNIDEINFNYIYVNDNDNDNDKESNELTVEVKTNDDYVLLLERIKSKEIW